MDRKKMVEQRLEEQKIKTENYLKELKDKQEQLLERATLLKEDKTNQLKQKAMLQNETVRQKHEQLKENQKQTMQETSAMHETLDATLSAAEMKARRKREEEISKIKAKLQKKIDKSQQKQRQMEDELKNWQAEILIFREQQDKHADELSQAQLTRRREMAGRVRESKEKQQRENMQRMLAQEDEWRASVTAQIQLKEERRKAMQQEKEAMIQKSRAQAQMTRRMREELRMNYSMNDLDKLSKQVLFQNKVLSP